MFSNGNNAKGTKAVAGKGIASVAHQHAINNTTPATCQASIDRPPGGEVSKVKKKRINPETKPKNFGLEKPIAVLPTLHPAYLLRAPAQKKFAFADLVLLKRCILENETFNK